MENTTSTSDSTESLHQRVLSEPAHPQPDCMLLRIPREIRRAYIFLRVLNYNHPPVVDQQYGLTRPSYNPTQRTDKALLRTCRAIYKDTWWMPSQLNYYNHLSIYKDTAALKQIVATSPDVLRATIEELKQRYQQSTVEARSLRIFTQMYSLEKDCFAGYLNAMRDLTFRRLYITIRHADFYNWEENEPLLVEGFWIPRLCNALPSSLWEVFVEVETVERKAAQLEELVAQMKQRWHFRTKDGKRFFADSRPCSHSVSTWRGCSTWDNARWIRDELSEGVIEYYIASVRFLPKATIEAAGGTVCDEALQAATSESFVGPSRLYLPNPQPVQCDQMSIPKDLHELQQIPEHLYRLPRSD